MVVRSSDFPNVADGMMFGEPWAIVVMENTSEKCMPRWTSCRQIDFNISTGGAPPAFSRLVRAWETRNDMDVAGLHFIAWCRPDCGS